MASHVGCKHDKHCLVLDVTDSRRSVVANVVVKSANAMHCMCRAGRWAVRQISGLLSDYLEGITEQNLQVRHDPRDVDVLD